MAKLTLSQRVPINRIILKCLVLKCFLYVKMFSLLFIEQSISIPLKETIYQEISNWPPGEEWFVKFSFIRGENITPWQKLLWFKSLTASQITDDGLYSPMFELGSESNVQGVFSQNGGYTSHQILVLAANTKVQISVEQRRNIMDGKLYIKFFKDGVMIDTAVEVTHHQVFERVSIIIGLNQNEIDGRVSEFQFGKL